jgi:uncharacterized protein YcbX
MSDTPNLSLTGIHLYPVKGAAGLSQRSCTLDSFGIVHDRRWMVVDTEGGFLSQRTQPRMALMSPRIEGDALCLEAPGMPALHLPVEGAGGEEIEVRIWRDRVRARVVASGAEAWLCDFLDRPARLVHMGPEEWRGTDPRYAEGSRVSFADGYPLHLLSEESLADLNERLDDPVPMNRFRPNLVVRGMGPYMEDRWRRLRIGEVELKVVKPCARCAVITVDQSEGVAHREPLATLSSYRSSEGKVYFGQNVVHLGAGRLEVGERVEVLGVGSPRPRTLAETNE